LRVLVLGGTSQASELARALADRPDVEATLSLAGRTSAPAASPLPTRIGGFGGAEGLAAYLLKQGVEALIDATHPFAARISANAVVAAREAGVALAVLSRPPWRPGPGDRWREVAHVEAAAEALGETPLRVFLTVGRLQAGAFGAAPQHWYLVRSIDPPDDLPPHAEVLRARPPFSLADEIALMRTHRIDVLVSKNAGGPAARAKLDAARGLGLPVVMIARPAPSEGEGVENVEATLRWIEAQRQLRGVSR
jgi:precorrin-6A/cobalt-precorrin-6A reductase